MDKAMTDYKPLTPGEIEAAERLCQEATPGTWRAVEKGNSIPRHTRSGRGGRGMNRQEAAIIIKAIGKHAIETHLTDPGDILDATVMAVEALVPKPDEVTGLMPCGCGEKAMLIGLQGFSYECIRCGTTTRSYEKEGQAKEAWNRAMGFDGEAMESLIRSATDPAAQYAHIYNAIEEGKRYTITKRNGQLVLTPEGMMVDWKEGPHEMP